MTDEDNLGNKLANEGKDQKIVSDLSDEANDNDQILTPFSYVDTALGFAYFNLKPETLNPDSDKEIQDALGSGFSKTSTGLRREHLVQVISKIGYKILLSEFREKFFHECHHCLQRIFYPYLYLQSWRELTIALNFGNTLRNPSRQFELGRIGLAKEWSDTFASYMHKAIMTGG